MIGLKVLKKIRFIIIKEYLTWIKNYLIILQCLFSTSFTAEKRKKYLFVINTLFFVLISTHKRQRGNLEIIFLPISFKGSSAGLPPMSNLCAAFIQHMKFQWNPTDCSNQFHIGKPSLTLSSSSSALPWLCIMNSKVFSVSHTYFTSTAIWLHWPQMKTTRMQIQQSKHPNFDVSHYLHKPTRFVLHCIWLQNNTFTTQRWFVYKRVLQGEKSQLLWNQAPAKMSIKRGVSFYSTFLPLHLTEQLVENYLSTGAKQTFKNPMLFFCL